MNQSFAYHSILVWLSEVLFRVYTSCVLNCLTERSNKKLNYKYYDRYK